MLAGVHGSPARWPEAAATLTLEGHLESATGMSLG